MIVMVTGGCGFIGSNFIEYLLKNTDISTIINVDSLTYAGAQHIIDPRVQFKQCDIGYRGGMKDLLEKYKPNVIVNFAAETHVDRSIVNSTPFLYSNVVGVHNLLCELKSYMSIAPSGFKLVHISTDEVYGSLDNPTDSAFTEESQYNPNSPYAASKASADHFVRSFYKTHGVPSIVVHCSNNYGPRQYKEKFIPVVISNILARTPVPIYGDGSNMREWLYVEDCCKAIAKVMDSDYIGERFNIGSTTTMTNFQLAQIIVNMMGESQELLYFVDDRLGHDFRYALDSSKIERLLGWNAITSISNGLERTIAWYAK